MPIRLKIKNKRNLIKAALGEIKAEIVIKSTNLINVITGEIQENVDIAIWNKKIVSVGDCNKNIGNKTLKINGENYYAIPGLIDAHTHFESSHLTLTEFSKHALIHGTTTIILDPHETANITGFRGIKTLIKEARTLPLTILFTAPSCVPSTKNLETTGARLPPNKVGKLLAHQDVVALAEVMAYPQVIQGDIITLEKIRRAEAKKLPCDGHCPSLKDSQLNAYIIAGITSDHESTTFQEALEKLRLGMWLMLREGTASKDMEKILPQLKKIDHRRIILVSDDISAEDLLTKGYMDYVVAKAISIGVDPIKAIQMVTINPADRFNLQDKGKIIPGAYADIILLSNLEEIKIEMVLSKGNICVKNGKLTVTLQNPKFPPYMTKTMNVKGRITPESLKIKAPNGRVNVNIIRVIDQSLLTKAEKITINIKNNEIDIDKLEDVNYAAVIERHKATGNIGKGLLSGLGNLNGAIASTVAHDSHNLIVVGRSLSDMSKAANILIQQGGGIVVISKGEVKANLPLPIMGLLSPENAESVANKMSKAINEARKIGCTLTNPFATLSFIALPVIPELKLTDKGLIDVTAGKIVSLIESGN